jgi:MerR family copper efflux transcriptional regulator
VRITEAARRLGTSPRMLRYRESLGLLPPVRQQGRPPPVRQGRRVPAASAERGADGAAPGSPHRRFTERDIEAVRLALAIERRYDISPAGLAFGLRVLADPGVRAQLAELAWRLRRASAAPARALDFEKERALRLLGTR